MNIVNNIKEHLRDYIVNNEVVFQACGELIEVANELEEVNRKNLLDDLNRTSKIEVYEKDSLFIKDDFLELNDWSFRDDVLFLLQTVGVLICIARKEVLNNGLIAA